MLDLRTCHRSQLPSTVGLHLAFTCRTYILTPYAVFVTVGGAFFLSAAQSAFNNQLIKELGAKLPNISPEAALGTGATQIREAFTATQVPIVLDSYMTGLKAVFAITIAAFGVSTLVGVFGSWKKLHGDDLKKAAGGAA